MHISRCAVVHALKPVDHRNMADWSIMEHEWPQHVQYDPYFKEINPFIQEMPPLDQSYEPQAQSYFPSLSPDLTLISPQSLSPSQNAPVNNDLAVVSKGDSPREMRNKAEKQRRDKLNQSINELASIVPPIVAANRKIDKTGVLRLTAHYLRATQYVFDNAIEEHSNEPELKADKVQLLLSSFLKGFLLTTTYKGLVVVVSQNVQQYLGYSELDLLGQNIFNIVHPDDLQNFKNQLMPDRGLLGPNGELLTPDEPQGIQKIAETLSKQKMLFETRFKKLSQRSEPKQYVRCTVSGSLRKSDRACQAKNQCYQMVRRARARGNNPCSSGNDVVFIGVVQPMSETFIKERQLESYKMEYRTRHLLDGEIIECEQRIALVTGYMIDEVNGVNAMNFMHRDDVRWVIIALREMYDNHVLVGESCYRLMARSGQFVFMKTRGQLDIEDNTRAVRTFVCLNTMVEEEEGKKLIKLMKKKFMLKAYNKLLPKLDKEGENKNRELVDGLQVPIEDPRQLEKIILHLVKNLPSPQRDDNIECIRGPTSPLPLAIIPPKKERIVSAIEKIYGIIKSFPISTNLRAGENMRVKLQAGQTPASFMESAPRSVPAERATPAPPLSPTDTISSYTQSTPGPSSATNNEKRNDKRKNKFFSPLRLKGRVFDSLSVPEFYQKIMNFSDVEGNEWTLRGRSETPLQTVSPPSTSGDIEPPIRAPGATKRPYVDKATGLKKSNKKKNPTPKPRLCTSEPDQAPQTRTRTEQLLIDFVESAGWLDIKIGTETVVNPDFPDLLAYDFDVEEATQNEEDEN